MSERVFVTFGAGGDNYTQAGERLIAQATNTGLFDEVLLRTDKHLKDDDTFWTQHEQFIMNNKRGYGYWLWKSWIVCELIKQLNDGDMLMYLDCGCEIGGDKQQHMQQHFELVKQHKIISGVNDVMFLAEQQWCKMDLAIHLDMNDEQTWTTSQQEAGALLFEACEQTRMLTQQWYETACDYHLIDDSPSVMRNRVAFIEHRHDQSILSLLIKRHGLVNSHDMKNCTHYIRNKTGNSRITG